MVLVCGAEWQVGVMVHLTFWANSEQQDSLHFVNFRGFDGSVPTVKDVLNEFSK